MRNSILALLALATAGCGVLDGLGGDEGTCIPDGPTRGYGMPENPGDLLRTRDLADVGVFWRGDWRKADDAADLVRAARENCFAPTLAFSWTDGDGATIAVPANADNTWRNGEAANAFVAALARFAAQERPPYVFLGFESDFYYADNLLDYPRWIDVYARAYDAIKEASPETRVGPSFSFEHLAGSGLFAGWTTPRWEALRQHDFDRVDAVGLTLFPFLQVTRPSDLPLDYLDVLFANVDRPVAILETGWPARRPDGGSADWDASPARQLEYATRLGQILAGRDVPVLHWLHDAEPTREDSSALRDGRFASVALREANGAELPVYRAWFAP